MALALGGRVNGGQFYGEFPGLDKASLFENQDLDTTTDYRQILAEALVEGLALPPSGLSAVFPALGSYSPMGIFGN